MKNYVNNYFSFINEDDTSGSSRPLKGIPAKNMIKKIEMAMEYLPDDVQFGVPSDNLGHSTSYKSPIDAIQRIKDLQHYYKRRGKKVRFYCRSITFTGTWESTRQLEKQMVDGGQLYHEDRDTFGDIDLKKIADYLKDNPEDADNFGKFALSIDSEEAVEFLNRELEKEDKEEEEDLEVEEAPEETSEEPSEEPVEGEGDEEEEDEEF